MNMNSVSVLLDQMRVTREHLTPEMALKLLTPECPAWSRPPEEGQNEPFWAIYWPGGQALARFILDHPQVVQDKSVLDLGCGCGAGAIAAKMSQCEASKANDVDELALEATLRNARANDVLVEPLNGDLLSSGKPDRVDVLLLGDMLFDAELGPKVLSFAEAVLDEGGQVLVGDPGRWFLVENRHLPLRCLAKYWLSPKANSVSYGHPHAYVYQLNKQSE